MKKELEEEKELLRMKGDALRMRLYAQSTNRDISSDRLVNSLSVVASSLNQPIIRSLGVSMLSRILLNHKMLTCSVLGGLAIYLLTKDKSEKV